MVSETFARKRGSAEVTTLPRIFFAQNPKMFCSDSKKDEKQKHVIFSEVNVYLRLLLRTRKKLFSQLFQNFLSKFGKLSAQTLGKTRIFSDKNLYNSNVSSRPVECSFDNRPEGLFPNFWKKFAQNPDWRKDLLASQSKNSSKIRYGYVD